MPTVDLTRIGSNIGAMYSLQSLLDINNKLSATQTRLSTGKRINSASDDPAGLTIATKMNARSEGLRVVQDNISDAKNMLSVAEAGLSKLTDILTTMRSKANQAASDTLGTTERKTIQSQLQSYAAQVDDIINETKWNGVKLLDGSVSKTFQTGVDEGETTTWSLNQKHDAKTLKIASQNDASKLTSISNDSSFDSTVLTYSSTGSNVSSMMTGTYSVEIADISSGSVTPGAGSGTQGAINLTSNNFQGFQSLVSGSLSGTGGVSGDELASGVYNLKITNVSSGSVSYAVTNASGSILSSGTTAVTAGSIALQNASLSRNIGLTLNLDPGAVQAGTSMSFEYIKTGDVKYTLKDNSGIAQYITANGTNTGARATAGYISASAATTVDLGVGAKIGMKAWANLSVGQKQVFDYEEAGQYVVNVSTASKASSYMTKVNDAMDVVNQSMADLGSLMARMDIKEEAASSARINVESAYNRIMNANMAEEQVNASKYAVLQQTAVAMLAQANQAPQALLSLFQ